MFKARKLVGISLLVCLMLFTAFSACAYKGELIFMSYDKPTDFSCYEIFVSLTGSFNPTGWNGASWTGTPNDPSAWNGSTNTLYKVTAEDPVLLSGLNIGTVYYVKYVVVDTLGRRSDPSNEVSGTVGGYQRSATFVVAANNANVTSKNSADYKCTGTNDQVQIQAALDALPEVPIDSGTVSGVPVINNNFDCETDVPKLDNQYTTYNLTSAALSVDQKYTGTKSLKLITDNTTNTDRFYQIGQNTLNGLTAGSKYRFSSWVYVPSGQGITLTNVYIFAYRKSSGGSYTGYTSTKPTLFDTWQFIYIDMQTATGDTEIFGRLQIGQDVHSKAVYFDNVAVQNIAQAIFPANLSAINDDYNGLTMAITAGTNSGQSRTVIDYDGANKIVTVNSPWPALCDYTSVFELRRKNGKIVTTDGVFNISDTIYVPSGAEWENLGGVLRLIDHKDTGDFTLVRNKNATGDRDITLTNLVIDGNKINQGAFRYHGLYFTYTKNSKVNSCKTSNFKNSGYAIYLNQSSGINVSGCTSKNNDSYGIGGFYLDNCTITGNFFERNLYGGTFVYSNNCRINSNSFSYNTSAGIYFDSLTNTSVSLNTVTNCSDDGIYLLNSSNCKVNGNTVNSNGISNNNQWSGIFIISSDNNSIQDNQCRLGSNTNKPGYGIRVYGAASDNNVIVNNDCYNSGVTAGIIDTGTGTIIGNNRMNNGAWTNIPN